MVKSATRGGADLEIGEWRRLIETSCMSVIGMKRRGRCAVDDEGESPEGISPPGAPRTVREPLDSYGSRCSAVPVTEQPVGEE
jgi:hypothetical protein